LKSQHTIHRVTIQHVPSVLMWAFFSVLLFTFIACSRENNGNRGPDEGDDPGLYSWTAGERDILYHMSLPAQMTRIFEDHDLAFQPELPNPVDSMAGYDTPVSMAANLGIYGADLGYLRAMGQDSATASYMMTIYALSGKLNIPREIYSYLLVNLDDYFNDPDEMAVQIDTIFTSVSRFLKENDQEHLIALMMLGGWTESLYIASQLYIRSPDNFKLLERIAEQKYSLNYLINSLNHYQDDPVLLQYNLMLKNLKRSYDNIRIAYNKGDVRVDTITKTITANEYHLETSRRTILEIASKIQSIRSRLVS
jgi:hypothetical protein